MTEYLVFLRAVNVGKRTVRMERLRGVLEELGLADVGTYINSGNAYFRATGRRTTLARRIEEALAAELGFDVPVALRTVDEVAAVVAADPFAGVEMTEHTRCCVAFAVAPLPADVLLPVASPTGEVEIIAVRGADAFVVLHQRPDRAANAGPFLEKALGVPSTSRFFHTTEKIVAAARKGLTAREG